MTNHYHLALTTREANLSRAIQQLNAEYAQWWNWRHERAGHLFEGRFKAQVVQGGRHLANVCRYVVLNPVRAQIVDAAEDWRWSSYRAMVGLAVRPTFLDVDTPRGPLAPGDRENDANRFRQFVEGVDPQTLRLSREVIVGDDEFVARFRPYRDRTDRELPRGQGRRSLNAIFEGAVSRRARDAAILIAVGERYALADVARFLEVHPSTVSKVVSTHGVRA
jgi:putative transposase